MGEPDPDIEASAAALMALTEHGVPIDMQELLVRGCSIRGIMPGALSAATKATLQAYRRAAQRDMQEVGG